MALSTAFVRANPHIQRNVVSILTSPLPSICMISRIIFYEILYKVVVEGAAL